MPTNTYVALKKEIVTGSPASSVTFDLTGITGYTDLVIVAMAKNSVGDSDLCIRFNADTTTNYSATFIYGNGTNALSSRSTNLNRMRIGRIDSTNAYPNIIQIQNYANSTTCKTVISRSSNTSLILGSVGLWRKTPEAITSITLIDENASNFTVGSTFTLYGIKAQVTPGTAKATGGTIAYDNFGYVYHTFTSSGDFTPSVPLSCDYLIVAGGGAGGGTDGGGGGAGGFRYLTSQSLSSLTPITVGGGGTGAVAYSQGTNGINSSVGAISATGGGKGAGGSGPQTFGTAGGSGGGGAGNTSGGSNSYPGGAGNAGSYSPVEGFAGGVGKPTDSPRRGAGGGGAGGVGVNGDSTSNGGVGSNILSSWATVTGTGVSGYYAGGGGGGVNGGSAGAGGAGGGSAGAIGAASGNATANTGGGSGGGGNDSGSGNGGSGIVIIRYQG